MPQDNLQKESTEKQKNTSSQQTIIIQQKEEKSHSNSMGTAGFVLALIGLLFCWVPVLNFILWVLGTTFSFIGVFKKPKGLAIAGLCLSSIAIIIIIGIIGLLTATAAAS